jgi:hypothetical protein
MTYPQSVKDFSLDEFFYFCTTYIQINSESDYIMNIHEYQGKEILASYGFAFNGIVANNGGRSGCCCKTINLTRNGLVCC